MFKNLAPLIALILLFNPVQAETKEEETARLWREIPRQMALVWSSFGYCQVQQGHMTQQESTSQLADMMLKHLTPEQANNLMQEANITEYVASQGGCHDFIKSVKAGRK